MTRHFLRDDDLTPEQQHEVLSLAAALKQAPFDTHSLAGPRTVATIYDKPTLRTQASFAAGIAELGGHPMLVDGGLAGIGRRESVADVARVLDHFGAKKAHIVGLSMGGRIAQDFAALYPDRLLSLTLCDTHMGFSNFSDEKRREFIRLRKEPLLNGGEPKDIAGPVAKTLVGPNASKESFDALVDSMSRLHKESYIKTIEASAMAGVHGKPADIRVPTHVIVGGEDRLTTPAMCRELADLIPGARFTLIPDAGHLVNIEKPAEFNAAAIAFIRQVGN